MSAHPYIQLITSEPLKSNKIKEWHNIAKSLLPNGVAGSADILVNGSHKTSEFYVRKIGKLGAYVIPLTRDLTIDEAGLIAVKFHKQSHLDNWEVDWSQTAQTAMIKGKQQDIIYEAIAEQVAKQIHTTWINKRVNEGWNYGIKYNNKMRQDPSLLPWQQLNEIQKNDAISRVLLVFETMKKLGLNIIPNNDGI